MTIRHTLTLWTAALSIVVVPALVTAQTALKSPDQVRRALGVLNRVLDHTGRLITAKNYAQLPHENMEFKEGAEAVEKSIGAEPADFRAKIDPLLKKAVADSQAVADLSSSKDDAKLAAAYKTFTESEKKVIAAFPASVQPAPAAPKKD